MFDDLFDSSLDFYDSPTTFDDDLFCHSNCMGGINPGSGLPMVDCTIDVDGFLYGDGPSSFDS